VLDINRLSLCGCAKSGWSDVVAEKYFRSRARLAGKGRDRLINFKQC